MRITDNMRFTAVQRSLADLRSRQADVTNQISSGRRINAPSDDPIAAAALTRLAARTQKAADYRNTIGAARSDLSLAESTLAQTSELMVRAQELAVQGANGSLSGADRATLAVEVAALQEQLVSAANTRGARGFLFSGTQTSTAALSSSGAYQGDDGEQRVEISPGVLLQVTVTGAEAFTAQNGGTDAFGALESLRQALLADDGAQISASITNIEASRSQMVRVRAETGLIMNRLDAADEALAITGLEYDRRANDLGAVDPFKAIAELTQLSTSIEQAIAIARNTLNNGGENLF